MRGGSASRPDAPQAFAAAERIRPRSQTIPIHVDGAPATDGQLEACASAEPFALMVLGDSMLPEFEERDIVVIEPEGLANDGAYVLARWDDDWIFRQLQRRGERWALCPLNPSYPEISIPDLSPVRGVIIQKSKPGRRRASKRYVE
ncbi:MAG: S24 family peptidase [Burkholderiaceae bacterium]|nr:S24 family peptidase [Burkholderiaceae bacterium]